MLRKLGFEDGVVWNIYSYFYGNEFIQSFSDIIDLP